MTKNITTIKGSIEKDPQTGKDAIILTYKNKKTHIKIRISPYFGSNIYKFTYNSKDIFYCDYALLKERDWTGCFVLWPFPNRVRDKMFTFEGKKYSLKSIQRKKGNYPLIHGLVDNQIWHIEKIKKTNDTIQASTYIEIKPGSKLYKYYPFSSKLRLIFLLNEDGLKITYIVKNNSKIDLPFGFALHPYFSLLSGKNHTVLRLPAKHIMETDRELLPTGKLIDVKETNYDLNHPVPISQLSLDHVFTTLKRSLLPFIDYRKEKIKLYFQTSRDFTHAVIYTGEKNAICFENQTGSTDMINLYHKGVEEDNAQLQKAAHLLILPPGKTHTGFVAYKIKPY